MKKSLIFAVFAATALLVSCNNLITPDVPQVSGEKVSMTLSLGGSLVTKADVQTADEAKITSWQLWVYNADGSIDAYKEVGTSTSVDVDVTAGTKTFQVVANAPASYGLTSSKTSAQILATVSALTDNTASKFVMVGSNSAAVTDQNKTVTVNIDRVAARVVVKKVTNKLSSGSSLKIDAIYVTNVAGDCDLGFTSNYTVTNWYNKKGYYEETAAGQLNNAFVLATPAADVALNASYSTANTFYVYPNSKSPADGGTWSPRASKLVLKATIDSKVYYYPIQLPTIVNNHSYELDELIITRNGNKDTDTDPEDVIISSETGTVTINVNDWTVVPIVSGGVITI